MYSHLLDTIKYYKDKTGLEHATNTVLTASHASLLLSLKTTDSLVKELQQRVKEYKKELKNGGSVTVIRTTDTVYKNTNTTVSFPVKDSCKPEYKTTFKDKWIEYNIKANYDTISLEYKANHNFSVVIGEKRNKWYKKKYPFVDVSDENTYSKIKGLRAFEVKNNTKSRFSVGVQLGYGSNLLNLKGGFFPYIGIGGQFTILKL